MNISQIGFGVAFIAGLASFLSPCVLPLVPIYLAQLVGHSVYQSADGQQEQKARLDTFLHALMFVCGFTLAFVALGATASTLGSFLQSYHILLRQIGGIILMLFGLHLIGILKLSIFYWQKRFEFRPSRSSYPASLLIGLILLSDGRLALVSFSVLFLLWRRVPPHLDRESYCCCSIRSGWEYRSCF